MNTIYAREDYLGADEYIDVVAKSGLNRPIQDRGRVERMLAHANLILTARQDGRLVGFARSIALILEEGQLLHTLVDALAGPLQTVGPELAAVGMLVVQTLINFFIPSGSGQAFVTMPIMAPLGDLVGVSRQTAVLAYQFGDGFSNMIVPTNIVLMSILGIAGIPYDRWLRFIWPLLLKLTLAAAVALVVAVQIGYH